MGEFLSSLGFYGFIVLMILGIFLGMIRNKKSLKVLKLSMVLFIIMIVGATITGIQETNKSKTNISNNSQNDIFVDNKTYNKEEKTENKIEIYIGNKSSRKFHKSTCGEINKMSEKNKLTLNSRDEAIDSGYSPCQKCNP